MVRVSCPTKFHSFRLAEQLDRHKLLDRFYTIYHQRKNNITARFNKRQDNETISLDRVRTFPIFAALYKLRLQPFLINNIFDRAVTLDLANNSDYKLFIGWSGMSLRSIKQAKKDGKIVVLERGSSHIRYQNQILSEEYMKWGLPFQYDNRVIEQEEEEYGLCDFVSVPSKFVLNSFRHFGIPESKIFVNNFGASPLVIDRPRDRTKFTIVYLGALTLRKGIPYLFQALRQLTMPTKEYEVHFIGSVHEEIKPFIKKYAGENWKFFGHVSHHLLGNLLTEASVAVHPSLEEGLSMVIPQLMSSGIPVIATTNTGGADIITDGIDGYIVPIRSPKTIAEKIEVLFNDRYILNGMQDAARARAAQFGTWESYGDRYATFVTLQIKNASS